MAFSYSVEEFKTFSYVISLFQILTNGIVTPLFIYGMVIHKINPAFGVFVVMPSIMAFFGAISTIFHVKNINNNDSKLDFESKCMINYSYITFVIGTFNLISCINGKNGELYWIHDSYITNTFFIYYVSSILVILVSNWYLYKKRLYEESVKESVSEIVTEIVEIVLDNVETKYDIENQIPFQGAIQDDVENI